MHCGAWGFTPWEWLEIQDACAILVQFEEATKIVSHDQAVISDTMYCLSAATDTL